MGQSSTTNQPPTGPRLVQCKKLNRELPGLPAAPFANELGQRIYESISQEAWNQWIQHSLLLINERELRLSDPQVRQLLMQECEAFLFDAASATRPAGWVPPPGSVQIRKKS
ncbi:MAG: oxidative damage protection protein [Candidatus Latescibacterota bacterium]|nr:MAG: oxidative damage protection protein [Candidatus Latescibacterota bacterium]